MNEITNDEYIAAQDATLRPTLEQLRSTIKEAAPQAAEQFAHRMPCFYIGKTFLCGFCVFKKHIGFYPGGEPISVFAKRLKPYATRVGTVQFPLDKPLDFALIADMIKWRLK